MVCNKFVNHKPKGNRIIKKIESKTGISFTLDYHTAVRYTGAKLGGEMIMAIHETANNIVKAYDTKNEIKELLSPKEIEFIKKIEMWASKLRKSGKGMIVKVRLSSISLQESTLLPTLQLGAGPVYFGAFDVFCVEFEKMNLSQVKKYLDSGIKFRYELQVDGKIPPSELEFEFL